MYIRNNIKIPLQKINKSLVYKDWLIRQMSLIDDVNNILSTLHYTNYTNTYFGEPYKTAVVVNQL